MLFDVLEGRGKRFNREAIHTHTHTHTYIWLSAEELMILNCGAREDFFFKFYFIFKLYIIVLVLPKIKMNLPQVYMCSLS